MRTTAVVLVLLCVYSTVAAAAEVPGASEALHSRTLYLIRHGSYDEHAEAAPEKGPGLTALGIAQARLVAGRLRAASVHFDSITSSTLTRAEQTAAVIHESLPDVPLTEQSALVECAPPSTVELHGENLDEATACAKRLDEVFRDRFKPSVGAEVNEVIVAHGNVIRYLVAKALGVDTRHWAAMSVAHTSLTIIRVRRDGRMVVLAVGDVGHLPPNLQSWGGKADPQLTVPKDMGPTDSVPKQTAPKE